MSGTLDDISAALVAAGVGQITDSSADWMIYTGALQDSDVTVTGTKMIADRAIALYESPGLPAEEKWAIDFPSFQVRARGKQDDYQAVRAKMTDIFNALHAQETALGTAYVYCYCQQSAPMPMGQDEKRRQHFVLNFRVMRDRP